MLINNFQENKIRTKENFMFFVLYRKIREKGIYIVMYAL